jgi:hypothetical protein
MKPIPKVFYSLVLGGTALFTFAMARSPAEEIDKPKNPLTTKLDPGLVIDQNPKETPVQIALLLDTSNSMDGLIEQAKTQLWKIVNEFKDAKQGDKIPVVHVALYEYGNNNLSAGTNFVRQILPFTRDLDKVSDELFKLTTNGGSEYCGAVMREAIDNLAWDKSPSVYKAIFIAGNEPFTQGPVSADETCRGAVSKGVVVNTIHCGSETDGANGGWRRGAHLAEGKFLTIDQDKAVVHVKAPQDEGDVKLETVKEADLPEEMKKLKPEERAAYVEQKCAEREKLQTRIRELNDGRQKYVATQQKEGGEGKTLDTVIGKAVREQASARAEITFK